MMSGAASIADVVVVGAGAIGLTLAYELSCRGRKVIVLERSRSASLGGDFGRQPTSWAAAGILPPANLETATDPMDRLRGLSHQHFPQWTDRLHDETGIDCELDCSGAWYLADTVGEIGAMVGMVDYWNSLSIDCSEIGLAELVDREPLLRDWARSAQQVRAWRVDDEYSIRCPSFLSSLAAACKNEA